MLAMVSGVDPRAYLGWFLDQGYHLFLLDRATGREVGYPTAEALLASWDDPFRIEDLLLLPD
jgi:hypothetical protein